jgi:hypothetical protein
MAARKWVPIFRKRSWKDKKDEENRAVSEAIRCLIE